MKKSVVLATAAVALVAVGAASPATAAKPKKKPPITKSYSMTLPPLPDPPMGTSCTRDAAKALFHDETFTTTGAGTLTAEVSGFAGDWDITVFDKDGLVGQGDGTTTGGGAPATAGKDTFISSWKKGTTITVRTCNFAGSPQAKGSYTFTYK